MELIQIMDEKKDLRTGKAINMRKLIFAVIGVELVILLIIGTLGILIDKRSQPQDLDLGSWTSEFIKFEDGAWYTNPKITPVNGKDYINIIRGPDTPLESGSYKITINYECTSDQRVFVSDIDTNNLFIRSSYAKLNPFFTKQSWRIDVKRDIEKLRLYVRYTGKGDLKITGAAIQRDHAGFLIDHRCDHVQQDFCLVPAHCIDALRSAESHEVAFVDLHAGDLSVPHRIGHFAALHGSEGLTHHAEVVLQRILRHEAGHGRDAFGDVRGRQDLDLP